MNYSAPELLLIIAAIGAVLTSTITAWRNSNNITNQTADTREILMKAAVIEGHVNSKETKYVEQLVSKDTEIALLKALINNKEKTAALLAQAATNQNVASSSQSLTGPGPSIPEGTEVHIKEADIKGSVS